VKRNSRHQQTAAPRATRVAEQLHHELAELIRAELKDPRVGLVTITGLDITPDYAWATAYYTVYPDDEKTLEDTAKGLAAAAGFLQGQLGRSVRIHTTPRLKFVRDASLARGMQMDELIRQASRLRADS
jgi:ribosome-binding factor A